MDYYIGKRMSELRQEEAVRSSWQRKLVEAALSCCAAAKINLFERIKLALKIQSSSMCCFDVE